MNKVAALALVTALAGLGVKQEPARTYSDEDLYVLSHIISAEAGNCQREMMIGVGSVVLNRVASDDFPDTIYEVVFQRDPSLQYGPIEGTDAGGSRGRRVPSGRREPVPRRGHIPE